MCIKFRVNFPGLLTLILWGLSEVDNNEYWLTTVHLKQGRISLIYSFWAFSALATVSIDWILRKGGLIMQVNEALVYFHGELQEC